MARLPGPASRSWDGLTGSHSIQSSSWKEFWAPRNSWVEETKSFLVSLPFTLCPSWAAWLWGLSTQLGFLRPGLWGQPKLLALSCKRPQDPLFLLNFISGAWGGFTGLSPPQGPHAPVRILQSPPFLKCMSLNTGSCIIPSQRSLPHLPWASGCCQTLT